MTTKVLTNAERRDICRSVGYWPERTIVRIEDTGGLVWLHLSCGHVTPRRRRTSKWASIVCEQCATKSQQHDDAYDDPLDDDAETF